MVLWILRLTVDCPPTSRNQPPLPEVSKHCPSHSWLPTVRQTIWGTIPRKSESLSVYFLPLPSAPMVTGRKRNYALFWLE